jgi:hypothetical protein
MTRIDRRICLETSPTRGAERSSSPPPPAAELSSGVGASEEAARIGTGDDRAVRGDEDGAGLQQRMRELEVRPGREAGREVGLDRARALAGLATGNAPATTPAWSGSARPATTGLSGGLTPAASSAASVMPRAPDEAVAGAAGLGVMGTAGSVVGAGQHLDKLPWPAAAIHAPGLGAAGTALGAAASAGRIAAGVADASRRGATPENVGELVGGGLGVAGAVGGPVAKAISVGFAVGQWLDRKAGLSDAIARLASPSDDGLDVALPRLSALRPWVDRDARVRELVGALERYAAYEDRGARLVNAAARARGGQNVAHLLPSESLREAGHADAVRVRAEACGGGVSRAPDAACGEVTELRPPRALRDRIVQLARALQREADVARHAR